jgi:hypothetical protein
MLRVGRQLLEPQAEELMAAAAAVQQQQQQQQQPPPSPQLKFGFHRPPFRSVDHLQ